MQDRLICAVLQIAAWLLMINNQRTTLNVRDFVVAKKVHRVTQDFPVASWKSKIPHDIRAACPRMESLNLFFFSQALTHCMYINLGKIPNPEYNN